MTRRRTVAGGGIEIEVPPDRLVGWVDRFAERNGGLADLSTDGATVRIRGGDGTLARFEVPFGPMTMGSRNSVGSGGAGSGPAASSVNPWRPCWTTWPGWAPSG